MRGHFQLTLCLCFKQVSVQTFHIKMRFIYMKMNLQVKNIFIWMVVHGDWFWHRDKRKTQTRPVMANLTLPCIKLNWNLPLWQHGTPSPHDCPSRWMFWFVQDLHFPDSQGQQSRQKQRSERRHSLLPQILPLLCSILESEKRNEDRFLTC